MEEGQKTQWKKDKRTSNDLQNITQKTKDRATRTHYKPGVKSGAPVRVNSSCSTCDTRRVTDKRGFKRVGRVTLSKHATH